MRLTLPPMRTTSVNRIIELVKMAAAEHYRLCCFINPESKTFEHLAVNAANLPLIVKVVERKSAQRTWEAVLRKELNTNFPLEVNRPLWKVAIVASPDKAKEYQMELEKGDLNKEKEKDQNNVIDEVDNSLTVNTPSQGIKRFSYSKRK